MQKIVEFKNKKYKNLTPKCYEVLSETAIHIIFENDQTIYFDINDVLINGKKHDTIKSFVNELDIDITKKTIEQLNQEQYKELEVTDWYFIRKSELDISVPQEILDERDSIRKKYNDLKANVK